MPATRCNNNHQCTNVDSRRGDLFVFRVLRLLFLESLHLLLCRLTLMLGFPSTVGFAVNERARVIVGNKPPRRFEQANAVPLCQAISTHTRKIHEIDILHVRSPLQMLDELIERVCRRFLVFDTFVALLFPLIVRAIERAARHARS